MDNKVELTKFLKGPVIVCKGLIDEILYLQGGAIKTLTVDGPTSLKRCSGQGDILAGIIAELLAIKEWSIDFPSRCKLGCEILRKCSKFTYDIKNRSTNASFMLADLPEILRSDFLNP